MDVPEPSQRNGATVKSNASSNDQVVGRNRDRMTDRTNQHVETHGYRHHVLLQSVSVEWARRGRQHQLLSLWSHGEHRSRQKLVMSLPTFDV